MASTLGALLVCDRAEKPRLSRMLAAAGQPVVVWCPTRVSGHHEPDPVPEQVAIQVGVVVGQSPSAALEDVAAWRPVCGTSPLLLLVRHLLPDAVAAALRAGADGVLPVDLRRDAFVRSLTDLMAGQSVLPRGAVTRLVEEARLAPVPATGALSVLSPRELYVLRRLARGLDVADIAREAGVAETTVRSHLSRAIHKLHVGSRIEAIAMLARNGVRLPPPSASA
jgi:DNA-binding NarL/FixJ family response regulator